MDKLKKTKQTLAFILILAIAAIIFYVLFFNNLKEKNKSISLIKNETDIAIQKEIKLRSVKDLIKDTQENRFKLDAYFVADDRVVNFIEDVEQLGRHTGVDVEVLSVNVSEDVENKVSEVLNLDLKISGRWRDVFYFFTLIEKMPLKIDISKTNLQVVYNDRARKKSSGVWEGLLSVSTIKLK